MAKFKSRTSFLLLLVGMLYGSAIPVQKNIFSFVPSVFIEKSLQSNLSVGITKNCPDLRNNNTVELEKNNTSEFRGFQEELSHICQQSDVTPLCLTSSSLVNFICKQSNPAEYLQVKSELPNSASEICLIFQNETFLSKLQDAAVQSSAVPLSNQVSLSSTSGEFIVADCEKLCNSSFRLCQIILQSLRTIVSKVKPVEVEITESKPVTSSLTNSSNKTVSTASNATTTTMAVQSPEISTEKITTQVAVKTTESKDWNPSNLSPDGPEEDLDAGDEIEKPDIPDEGLDFEKDTEIGGNKQNDAYLGTPTKPSQSYDSQSEIDEDPVNTHFIFYFLAFVVISVCGYLLYQRRYRIIALVLEGRGGSGRRRGRSSRSRGTSGSYHKLVNNLEEAITSQSVKNSNVVY